ncbi:MAG: two-component system response regulator [Deltaproteobacteria bacterium]|nr:MAG: two-component system response regulator [Deltaproteobacteria bacterium]
MILLFVLFHYFWDYAGEDLLGLPGNAVDPVAVFLSAAIVYRIFLRDIESIFYPEGAVGKGSKPLPRASVKRSTGGAAGTGGGPSDIPPASRESVLPALSALSSPRADSILLVDEDPRYLQAARETLDAAGIGPVHTLTDGRETLSFLSTESVALLLLGGDFSEGSLPDLVNRIRKEVPQLPVIVMTRTMDVETAVACMKAGAFDYLVKPVEKNRFLSSVRRALEFRELRCEISTLTEHFLSLPAEDDIAFHGIRTKNRKMQAICRYVEAIAPSRHPVLITGETGVGKELIARATHDLSGCAGRFVAVNVAGLDDTMFSDTLFGHTKGAYTGADKKREGLLARASGGTLFLDEIGDLNESSQVKLLRLLEEMEYYPLGSDAPEKTDARILCATHHSLPGLLSAGEFRKDLFFRLQAHHVQIPSLRERMEDLPLLLDQCLEETSISLGKKKPTAPPELLKLLSAYHFPGNVRELRSMIFDAVTQHRFGVLSMNSFHGAVRKNHAACMDQPAVPAPSADGMPFRSFEKFPTLKEATDCLVAEAMKRSGNNQGIAALLLGITREALNKRILRQKRHFRKEPKITDAA